MLVLPTWRFVVRNVLVWVLMAAILVVVPDQLQRWMPFEIAGILGWTVAVSVWVVVVERQWQARFGPFARFGFQLVLWLSAALVATWVRGLIRLD